MRIQPLMLCVLLCARVAGAAVEDLPGYVDLDSVPAPTDAAESIEVSLKKPLLKLAAAAVRHDKPDLADMIDDIDLIRVTGFSVEGEGRAPVQAAIERLADVLEAADWERAARVRERAGDEFLVYLKSEGETIVGLLVMGFEGERKAVFVNLAGRIDPAEIGRIGSRLHISPLDSLQLQGGEQ